MTDIQLYTKISSLPSNLKKEVEDFIASKEKQKSSPDKKRKLGIAKGLIKIKDNFDDPIDGFNDYR